jgi:AcrR family transcriptional regulator
MPRPRSNLAPRILDAARQRILLEGVDGASLRQIAADAGTNIGMIYYYYPTKDDLFLAVLESGYAGLLVDIEKALAPDVSPEDRIGRIYARVGVMTELEFDVVRIIIREALVSTERRKLIAERMLRGHLPWLIATFAEGRGDGRFDPNLPLPVELATTVAIGIIPQLVYRLVHEANLPITAALPPRDEVPKLLLQVLLHGIGGPKLPS